MRQVTVRKQLAARIFQTYFPAKINWQFKLIQSTIVALIPFTYLISTSYATIIRLPQGGDPYLFPATYGYSVQADDTAIYPFGTAEQSDVKHVPISGSVTGNVRITYNGSQTILKETATASSSNASGGTVSASTQSDNFQAAAFASLTYYFTVVGPDAAYVPVTISGQGGAAMDSKSGWASNHAELRVSYFDGFNSSDGSIYEPFDGHVHHGFSDTINVKPNTNTANGAPRIFMEASASTGIYRYEVSAADIKYYGGTASAYIDPIISIADPKLASLYTIVVGLSSLPNTSPPVLSSVPLPASAPMFGAALMALGAISYGLKRRSAAAA